MNPKKRTKDRRSPNGDIKWTKPPLNDDIRRIDPDPERREAQPPRQYDPEVNRKVHLQKYQIREEIERNGLNDEFGNIKTRELGMNDRERLEQKSQKILNTASKIRRTADMMDLKPSPELESPVKKVINDPYQV